MDADDQISKQVSITYYMYIYQNGTNVKKEHEHKIIENHIGEIWEDGSNVHKNDNNDKIEEDINPDKNGNVVKEGYCDKYSGYFWKEEKYDNGEKDREPEIQLFNRTIVVETIAKKKFCGYDRVISLDLFGTKWYTKGYWNTQIIFWLMLPIIKRVDKNVMILISIRSADPTCTWLVIIQCFPAIVISCSILLDICYYLCTCLCFIFTYLLLIDTKILRVMVCKISHYQLHVVVVV